MDADVLVIGAGPVGLFLAAELALGGVRPLVLERLAAPATAAKARGIGVLATEALAGRGLGDALAEAHAAGSRDIARDHGSTLGHFAGIHKIDPALAADPDRHGTLIWQPELEALLAAHATRLGVRVLRDRTVTDLVSDVDGVRVTAGGETFLAPWLVGCDGGRSAVRRLAGFDFPGTDAALRWVAGRVRFADPAALPAPGRYPGGSFARGAADAESFGMAGTTEPAAAGAVSTSDVVSTSDGPVTPEELGASIGRVTGTAVRIAEIRESRRFGDAARQVPDYRRGRMLLAGDAAHVHSPNGGQGLNLGLLDALNLGWKLAAVARAAMPAKLLDSYTAERHPAGAAVLRNTLAQSALQAPGPQVDALREIVAEVLDLPAANRYFGELLSGTGLRYPLPYNVSGLPDVVGRHVPARDVPAHPAGRGLLLLTAGCAELAGLARGRVDVLRVERAGGYAGLLLRPDGVAAWAALPGEPIDESTVDTALHTWFG